jgi:hypothetical protein
MLPVRMWKRCLQPFLGPSFSPPGCKSQQLISFCLNLRIARFVEA